MMCGSNETESVPYTNPDDPFWKTEIADESALPVGVRVMTNLALDYLFGGK